MAVIPAMTTAIKKFYGKPMLVTSKVLGVATTASVIYDAHVNGRERAYSNNEKKSADTFYRQYKQYMTCEKESATLCAMKKWWFDVQRDFPLDNLAYKASGYISGFGKTVAREIPLLTLSALTLAPKNQNVNKVAGSLIAANAVITFFNDIVGIGTGRQ